MLTSCIIKVMPRKKILLAMFDVRPTGKSVGFDFAKISREINLRQKSILGHRKSKGLAMSETKPEDTYWEELFDKLPQRPDFHQKYELTTFNKGTILKELEKTISETVDVEAELASIGGHVHGVANTKPRVKVMDRKKMLARGDGELNYKLAMSENPETNITTSQVGSDAEMSQPPIHSPASREIEIWLKDFKKNHQSNPDKNKGIFLQEDALVNAKKPQPVFRTKPRWTSWFRFNRKAMMWFLGLALPGLLIFWLVRHQGIWARNNIVQNGSNAVANLEEAKQELENFNFLKAADSFALAYDDLNKASGTLSQLGASFLSIFGNLPGLNKVKAAANLVEAGQSLSKAGENLSLAFGTLYKTNLLAFLDAKKANSTSGTSISKLLAEFKDILIFADKNIKNADVLLADVDTAAIPSDKRQLFLDFKEKIPEFQKYIGDAINYSDFLLELVGASGTKTYLVLFQNNSELRPNGGFPGTYGLLTFEDGTLKKIFVNDVYQIDGQIKQNIIPPIPLQHITPNWGMRDAAWFADFPLSARKVTEFYKLDLPAQAGGGPEVDGVLTITPDVIAKIFEVIGPIEMPDYNLTLDSDNFMTAIQNQVEYKADRSTPKQIVSDLQPKFFEQLARQDKDGWLKIFKIISEAVEQKHILAFFKNPELEKTALKNGLGGEIKQSAGDYLQVVFSNVKGSKTDFVTENSMDLKTEIGDDGALAHTLTISRAHNGGSSKYGFYNRDNSAYVRVYVPRGATLKSIQGQSITDFKPLIGHEDFGFKKDPDLAQIEGSMTNPFAGVGVFEESGKTVFGFWLITKPGQTKTVAVNYKVPSVSVGVESVSVRDGYSLLWQKQSGTGHDQISFNFQIPSGKEVKNKTAGLEQLGDNLISNADLSIDRTIDIGFR